MNGSDWPGFREYVDERVVLPNGNDVENPTGEWIGTESNRERGERNDALVALASFVFGTITPGCGCEECDARRETVMTLIYGKDVNASAIDDAIQPVNPASMYDGVPCRWCGNLHEAGKRERNSEMSPVCARKQRSYERDGKKLPKSVYDWRGR
jgi:hypothetical protein